MHIFNERLDKLIARAKANKKLKDLLPRLYLGSILLLFLVLFQNSTGITAIGFGLMNFIDALNWLVNRTSDNFYIRAVFWESLALIVFGLIALPLELLVILPGRLLFSIYLFLLILSLLLFVRGMAEDRNNIKF